MIRRCRSSARSPYKLPSTLPRPEVQKVLVLLSLLFMSQINIFVDGSSKTILKRPPWQKMATLAHLEELDTWLWWFVSLSTWRTIWFTLRLFA